MCVCVRVCVRERGGGERECERGREKREDMREERVEKKEIVIEALREEKKKRDNMREAEKE